VPRGEAGTDPSPGSFLSEGHTPSTSNEARPGDDVDFPELLESMSWPTLDGPVLGRVSLSELWEWLQEAVLEKWPESDHLVVDLAPEDLDQDEALLDKLADALSRSASRRRGVDPTGEARVRVTLLADSDQGPGTLRIRHLGGDPLPPDPTSTVIPAITPTALPVHRPQQTDRPAVPPTPPDLTDLELIREGGSAKVYRAFHRRLDRTVAVKVYALNGRGTEVDHQRDSHYLDQLSGHPHIVTILETGYAPDGGSYLVMDYYPDGSYEDAVRRSGRLPVAEVLDVGVRIGETLHAVHQKGIIHCDVKPANILRSSHGPVLTDFGIAHAYGDLTGPGAACLTPEYASPEALRLEPLSVRSDVYSLAATMWSLLAGGPPHPLPPSGSFDLAAWHDHVIGQPLPPLSRADLPPGLVDELSRALSKRSVDRHPSALAFAESLAPRPGAASPPPQWPRAPRTVSPHRRARDG
jgi:hypothetical protein